MQKEQLENLLIPRPASLVVTQNSSQGYNVAPFSWFTLVSYEPPLLLLALKKTTDTLFNILSRLEWMCVFVDRKYAQEIVLCSRKLPYGICELDDIQNLKLGEENGEMVVVPNVGWIKCKFRKHIETGDHFSVIGEIVKIKEVDWKRLVLYCGGKKFTDVGEVYEVKGY